jgi:hypothetical protein
MGWEAEAFSAWGSFSTGAGTVAADFDFAARFILTAGLTFAFGLAGRPALRSNTNSTPISGWESAGCSAGGSCGAAGSTGALGSGFETLDTEGIFEPPKVLILPAALAFGGNLSSRNVDFGADLAVADGFLATGTSTAGFASGMDGDADSGFAFSLRFNRTTGFSFFTVLGLTGLTSLAGLTALMTLTALAVTGGFFAAGLGDFSGRFAVVAFARAFTRLRTARRGLGLAAADFFGFFMQCPCSGARSFLEIKPGISEAQRLFGFRA